MMMNANKTRFIVYISIILLDFFMLGNGCKSLGMLLFLFFIQINKNLSYNKNAITLFCYQKINNEYMMIRERKC